jgi:hypothetical protein
VQIGRQGEQSVVRDVRRVGRPDGPGGRLVVWRAGFVVLDGGQSGKRGVPYAVPRERQSALVARLPEQSGFWVGLLRSGRKLPSKKEPRAS